VLFELSFEFGEGDFATGARFGGGTGGVHGVARQIQSERAGKILGVSVPLSGVAFLGNDPVQPRQVRLVSFQQLVQLGGVVPDLLSISSRASACLYVNDIFMNAPVGKSAEEGRDADCSAPLISRG
jgi:hypothetical protein